MQDELIQDSSLTINFLDLKLEEHVKMFKDLPERIEYHTQCIFQTLGLPKEILKNSNSPPFEQQPH